MDEIAMMTAMPDEIVTKLIKKAAATKRENGLAPVAMLFAIKGGKHVKGGKGPNWDKRDNKNDRKEKKQQKCFQCQQRGNIT